MVGGLYQKAIGSPTIKKRKRTKAMKWKDLNEKQKKHLREVGITTLTQFKSMVQAQERMRKENPKIEPCWDCKFLARKLGLID